MKREGGPGVGGAKRGAGARDSEPRRPRKQGNKRNRWGCMGGEEGRDPGWSCMRGNRNRGRGAGGETRSKNRVCRRRSPLHLRIERAVWDAPPTRNTKILSFGRPDPKANPLFSFLGGLRHVLGLKKRAEGRAAPCCSAREARGEMVVGWAAGAPLLASHTGGLLYRAPLSACGWLTPSKPNSRGGHVLGGIREGSGEPSQTKKRHMALLFGYQGTGYFGLQSQRAEGTPGQPTISDVLRQGLLHSGAILHTNFSPLTRTKWSLASRTDKGVHAARASVSFKMETLDSQVEPFGVGECDDGGVGQRMQLTVEALEAINAHLPPEVQLFGGATVRKSFDSRECASSRTYEYLLPRSMLDGMTVSEFDAVMREFEGSQKVHNFCSGLRRQAGQWEYDGESWPLALDPRPRQSVAYRSVMRCGVRRTLTVKGEDYLVLEISGVSFMLHQIRHMVGTGLAIAHGLVPHDILPLALRSPLEINISPLAPATGLLLDEVTGTLM